MPKDPQSPTQDDAGMNKTENEETVDDDEEMDQEDGRTAQENYYIVQARQAAEVFLFTYVGCRGTCFVSECHPGKFTIL